MFDTSDPGLAAFLADVPEPVWDEHPVYAHAVSVESSVAQRLPELLAVVPAARPTAALAGLDPAVLSAGARVDLLALLEEQRRWLQAAQIRVLAAIDTADDSALSLSQEAVSLVFRIPVRTAQTKLKAARTLVTELPATLALLAAGQISGAHAQVITEQAWALPPDTVHQFQTTVLARAADQTVGQLRAAARGAAIAADPATAEQRHTRALSTRRVGYCPAEDGMTALPVLLPAAQAQLVFGRLTAAARLLPPGDTRTLDQQRADLLIDAILTGLPADTLPRVQGHQPTIHITVSADTLLNLDDEPAHLTGHGPITAETARRHAAEHSATWRRLLTDPNTGALLDISPHTYRPPQRLRDYTAARDDVCTFPTCNQPAQHCEYEHTTPHSQGGPTQRSNGALTCKRHNLTKINTGWNYTLNPDGTHTWTTDTGHNYTNHPPQRWPTPPPQQPHTDPETGLATRLPEPPPPRTPQQQRHHEDQKHHTGLRQCHRELQHATHAHNQPAITAARAAIKATHQQRKRQLAHRQDPTKPPF